LLLLLFRYTRRRHVCFIFNRRDRSGLQHSAEYVSTVRERVRRTSRDDDRSWRAVNPCIERSVLFASLARARSAPYFSYLNYRGFIGRQNGIFNLGCNSGAVGRRPILTLPVWRIRTLHTPPRRTRDIRDVSRRFFVPRPSRRNATVRQ